MTGCIIYPQPAMVDDLTTPSPPNDDISVYKTSHYHLNPSIASIIQQDYLSICESRVKMITQKNHPATHPIQGSVFGGFGTKRPKSGEQAFSGLIGLCYFAPNNTLNHCTKNEQNP